ncbi:MAG TPA: 2'-5' RNA ligase family protein [Pilimelia sp.]|nr:2'-5' RNA ligase family protein [Pilimelia sp.]
MVHTQRSDVAPDPATARIGVAVDIPEPWGSRLTRRRAEAGDPLAAVMPAHLTLLSPTEVPADALPRIERHLAEVAAVHRPYPLHLRGTGTFRPVTEVVFVAVAAGADQTRRLAAAIGGDPLLRRDTRFPYHPHVTVAHDVPTAALDAVHADLADFSARFTITGFTLFSQRAPDRWEPRREFVLGG